MNDCSYIKDYKIIATLGAGTYAHVQLASKIENGEEKYYALKIYEIQKDGEGNQLILSAEKSLQAELKPFLILKQNGKPHENIIQQYECFKDIYHDKNGEDRPTYVMVLEYAQCGSLIKLIAQKPISDRMCRLYFQQLISGLVHIHNQGLAHRDLKPENLLLDSKFNLKIADLGFTEKMDKYKNGYLKTILGTRGFLAPEFNFTSNNSQSQNKEVSYIGAQADIFACGIILFLMRTRVYPITKLDYQKCDLYRHIILGDYDSFWNEIYNKYPHVKNMDLSEDFKDLMINLISFSPSTRLSMSEIIHHPWMTSNEIATEEEVSKEYHSRKLIVQQKQIKSQFKKEPIDSDDSQSKNSVGQVAYRSFLSGQKSQFEGLNLLYDNIENTRDMQQKQTKEFQEYIKTNQLELIIVKIEEEQEKNILLKLLAKYYKQFSDEKLQIEDDNFVFEGAKEDVLFGKAFEFKIDLIEIFKNVILIDITRKKGDPFGFQVNVVENIRQLVEPIIITNL